MGQNFKKRYWNDAFGHNDWQTTATILAGAPDNAPFNLNWNRFEVVDHASKANGGEGVLYHVRPDPDNSRFWWVGRHFSTAEYLIDAAMPDGSLAGPRTLGMRMRGVLYANPEVFVEDPTDYDA